MNLLAVKCGLNSATFRRILTYFHTQAYMRLGNNRNMYFLFIFRATVNCMKTESFYSNKSNKPSETSLTKLWYVAFYALIFIARRLSYPP